MSDAPDGGLAGGVMKPMCRCGHAASSHYRDRKGRPTCGSLSCGCIRYRPRDEITFARHEHGPWCHPAADGCPETMPAPELSPRERLIVEQFDAADPAPESWDGAS